jgi:hypothetical protein
LMMVSTHSAWTAARARSSRRLTAYIGLLKYAGLGLLPVMVIDRRKECVEMLARAAKIARLGLGASGFQITPDSLEPREARVAARPAMV